MEENLEQLFQSNPSHSQPYFFFFFFLYLLLSTYYLLFNYPSIYSSTCPSIHLLSMLAYFKMNSNATAKPLASKIVRVYLAYCSLLDTCRSTWVLALRVRSQHWPSEWTLSEIHFSFVSIMLLLVGRGYVELAATIKVILARINQSRLMEWIWMLQQQ